jgi:hypothetical protein
LREILRGVDPDLDPSNLAHVGDGHVSSVNMVGSPGRISGGAVPRGGVADAELQHLNTQVAVIQKRMDNMPGMGTVASFTANFSQIPQFYPEIGHK